MEHLNSSVADAQTKITSIQFKTDAQVFKPDAKKKQLKVNVQSLLVMQHQVILRKKKLEFELLALQDQKQTTQKKVDQTQLCMYTLNSKKAAIIASILINIVPLQQKIQ